ncbi:glycosyltransferase [Knoellia aerolata]|uniref:glycosyltransferase n=1 Tax=Knoellia aerolata TaxID=442954 RepID=UPI000A07629C|nr:glycosyltransferase [Knoellia aerolata]
MTAERLPRISVVVLAYNHGPYIAQCLEGILAQDYAGQVEVLVGEDHSSDDTLATVKRYAALNPNTVHVLTSDTNVGMHANHRRLLDAASGDLVAYCEGDDYWQATDKLTVQANHLARHPHHVGVHSDVDHIIPVRHRWYVMRDYWTKHIERPAETTFDDLLIRNTVQTCSLMIRAEAATSYPSSTLARGRYQIEDWPLFLHATTFGPFGLVDRSLATYRRLPGSATQQGPAAAERRIMDQLRLVDNAVELAGLPLERRRAGAETTRDALVWNALSAGDGAMLIRALDVPSEHGANPHPRDALLRRLASLPVATVLGRGATRVIQARQLLKYRPE